VPVRTGRTSYASLRSGFVSCDKPLSEPARQRHSLELRRVAPNCSQAPFRSKLDIDLSRVKGPDVRDERAQLRTGVGLGDHAIDAGQIVVNIRDAVPALESLLNEVAGRDATELAPGMSLREFIAEQAKSS
jgi:hypothetical protein